MISDSIKAAGEVTLVLTDQYGAVKQQDTHNLVVTIGKAFLSSRLGVPNTLVSAMTASQSGTTLTVTALTGSLQPGHVVTGSGISANTVVLSQLTGTIGGIGTYQVSTAATVGSAGGMTAAAAPQVGWMALGTNAIAAATSDIALGTEITRAAVSSTSIVTTTTTNDAVQYIASYAPGVATGPLTEAGLFTAASGGVMLSRTVFPVINKGALDTLGVTWKITQV